MNMAVRNQGSRRQTERPNGFVPTDARSSYRMKNGGIVGPIKNARLCVLEKWKCEYVSIWIVEGDSFQLIELLCVELDSHVSELC